MKKKSEIMDRVRIKKLRLNGHTLTVQASSFYAPSLAILEPNIEEEEAKVPTASSQSKTMSCRKTAKHKTRLKSNGVVSH